MRMPSIRSSITVVLLVLCGLHSAQLSSFAEDTAASPRRAANENSGREEKLAALYIKLGKLDQCRAIVTSLLRQNPTHFNALLLLAKLEFQSGNSDQAEKAASAALKISPSDIDALLIKSNALNTQGKSEEAAQLLAHVSPSDLAQHRESLARSLNGGVQPPGPGGTDDSSGEEALDNALEAARRALESKDFNKADSLTENALKRWPTDHTAMLLRADYLSGAHRPAEAITLLEKLKAAHDSAAGPFPGQLELAFALQDVGRKQEATREFEAIAADQRFSDADRKLARKTLADERGSSLLDQGDKALDKGDVAEATRINDVVQKENPDSIEAKRLNARVLTASKKHAEALQVLTALKEKNEAGKRFDGQLDYAESLAASHRYQDAAIAYREILTASTLYTKEEHDVAQKGLRDLHDNNPAGVSTEITAGRFDEGKIWRAKAQFFSGSYGGTQYQGTVGWDGIKLSSRLFPTRKSDDRINATVGATHQFDKEWTGAFTAGGFSHGAMGSAMAEYTSPDKLVASLRAAYNDPARDTLLLEAMDGRQHSLVANFAAPLGKYFAVDSNLIARQVAVDQHEIGHSYGVEAQFRWHPLTVSHDVYLAYALEVKDFSGKTSAFDRAAGNFFGTRGAVNNASVYDAVPEHINRHALQVHAGSQLSSSLKGNATAELAWREEAKKWEAGIAAELLWSASDNLDITARAEYSSGGAGPNTNGNVILSTLGVRWYW